MNGDIYDQNGKTIYVKPQDVWPHVVYMDIFGTDLDHKCAFDPIHRLQGKHIFSSLGIRPHYIYSKGVITQFYRRIAGSTGGMPDGYRIKEILTKGGVFLRNPEDIISWLLDGHVYFIFHHR